MNKFKPDKNQQRSDKKFRGPYKYQLNPLTGELECKGEMINVAPEEFWCDGCNMWLSMDLFRMLIILNNRTNLTPEDDIHLCVNCYEWKYLPWSKNFNKE